MHSMSAYIYSAIYHKFLLPIGFDDSGRRIIFKFNEGR